MTQWIDFSDDYILSVMPTELLADYSAWLIAYPDRTTRLADITLNYVASWRQALLGDPSNILSETTAEIPRSLAQHCQNQIFGALCHEMGISLSQDISKSLTQAEIQLRQCQYGNVHLLNDDDVSVYDSATPGFSRDWPKGTERKLPDVM